MVKVGDVVTYISTTKTEHDALILEIHGQCYPEGPEPNPSINLVIVNADPEMRDSYGQQIKRESSIVHISNNSALANCWKEK